MNEYTFPFNTCEKVNKRGIAQPYSVLINVLNCLIILYFLIQTKHYYTFILLLSIFLFEAFHVFSHMKHIPGTIQVNITHSLSYAINFSLLYAFYQYTHIFPNNLFLLFYFLLICLDIYLLYHWSIIFYLFSQAALFLSVLFYYYSYLPKSFQKNIFFIFPLVILIILLFINEKTNCQRMLYQFPYFPFHILIEMVGLILFTILCNQFYQL